MKNKRLNSGITLIALIITVIVLLILAGTAISISLNSGDILSKATTARSEYNNAVSEEERILNEQLGLLDYDPYKITVNARQNNGMIEFTFSIPGNKSISEASLNEKLDAIANEWIGKVNWTREDVRADLESRINTYEGYIEAEIEYYNITGMEGTSENAKLDAILVAWKNAGRVDDDYTREDVKNKIESWPNTIDEAADWELEDMGITYLGENPEMAIMYGGQEVNENVVLLGGQNYGFAIVGEGIHKVVVTTASGKRGEAEVNVNFNGLTLLRILDYSLLYNSSSITTWSQLVDSEYNTIGLRKTDDNYVLRGMDMFPGEHVCTYNNSNYTKVNKNDLINPQTTYYLHVFMPGAN